MRLTPRQSTLIFGWLNPREELVWSDILKLKLTMDQLVSFGLNATDLLTLQPDPSEWTRHAGAGLKHARFMQPWGANPFAHFGADLADVISMKLSLAEMLRMDISYAQLVEQGMTEHTERLFKLDDEEWQMLGRRSVFRDTESK